MLEKVTNFWVSVLGKAQPDTHVFNVEVGDGSRWFLGFEFFEIGNDPGRPNNRYSIIRSWGSRSIKIPKLFPRIAEVAERVTGRQF